MVSQASVTYLSAFARLSSSPVTYLVLNTESQRIFSRHLKVFGYLLFSMVNLSVVINLGSETFGVINIRLRRVRELGSI